MDCKSSSGNQPPPVTGLPGTIVAEGLRKMQVVNDCHVLEATGRHYNVMAWSPQTCPER